MYRVIKEIKEVRHYSMNYILLLNDDVYFNNSKIFVIDKSRKILQKEKVIILDSLNKGYFVENDSNNKIMNHEFRVLSFTNNFIGFYKYGEKKLNGIYSLSINSVLFTTKEYLGRNIIDDVILSETIDKKIICRSVFTGRVLWEYPLKKYGTYIQNDTEFDMSLSEIYGVHDNLIYVKIGVDIILGIHIETGKEIFRYDYNHSSGGLMNTKLDKKSNQIFSIGPKHYIEIDLSTGTSNLYDISSSVKEHQVEPYNLGSWQEDEIYFYEGGFDNCKFGVFSRSIKKIIYSGEAIDEEGNKYPIKDVKHSDNKLYVHDKNNTLHIFEKEQNIS